MVDPRDLGLVTQVRSPHAEEPTIYLYEAVPGRDRPRADACGTGTTSCWPAAAELIAGCGCDGGCPACTGPRLEPGVDARALALRLLARAGCRAVTGPRALATPA